MRGDPSGVREPPPVIGRAGRRPRQDPPAPPPRRRAHPLRLVVLLTLLAGVVVGAYVDWALGPAGTGTTPVEFEVPRGASARTVATRLFEAGLVRDPSVFLALLRWQGIDRQLGEGLYDLEPAMDALAIAAALQRGGRPRTLRLVIPEGSRLVDVAARLHGADIAPAEVALELATEPEALLPEHAPDGATLEGYLFPATYEIPVDEGADEALARMVGRFERELDAETQARLRSADLDVHSWVVLASMVQAEAANDGEMAVIAGVFLNRLDLGMPLQSDPTVAYGLGKDLQALDFPGGDFELDHPWNTYTRAGLPAGPIGNPGRAALDAVLAPERLDPDDRPWLYFLHGSSDDGPVFRPNIDYDDHLRDVARFIRR